MTKFTPMGDRVLVKLYPVEEISPGGIHLSDSAKAPSHKATIIAKSHTPTVEGLDINQRLQVGDTIILIPGGHNIVLDGEKFTILQIQSILGVLFND